MRIAVDPARAGEYPPNIQAILKRPAPAAAALGQCLLEIDAETGEARIAYRFGPEHLNRFGTVHGGPVAAVLDDAVSVAAGLVAQWGEITPTLEMKVSYLAQAGEGGHVATARIVRRGRTILFLEGELMREDGRTIARASATALIAPMKGSGAKG